jgi:hypothetical protein
LELVEAAVEGRGRSRELFPPRLGGVAELGRHPGAEHDVHAGLAEDDLSVNWRTDRPVNTSTHFGRPTQITCSASRPTTKIINSCGALQQPNTSTVDTTCEGRLW